LNPERQLKIGLPDIQRHEEGDYSLPAFIFLIHGDLNHSSVL